MPLSQDRYPRMNIRNEVFDIMYEYKEYDMDIGDAYDQIFDLIEGSVRTFPKRSTRKGQIRKTTRRAYTKRKLNSWQKFVKANSKKRKFRFKDGKLKLKSMGIAYRKTAAYKRSKK